MKLTEQTARAIAEVYHGDQMYGDKPYIYHLDKVAGVLKEFGFDEQDYLSAAYLHDILEDTHMPAKTLVDMVGVKVTNIVWAVTGFGDNRYQRMSDAFFKIRTTPAAAIVKAADRIANVREGGKVEMYKREWPMFEQEIGHLIPNPLMVELKRLHAR